MALGSSSRATFDQSTVCYYDNQQWFSSSMQPTCCGTAGADIETVSSMHHARQDRDGDGTSARDSESSVLLHGNRRRATAPTDAQIRNGVTQERVGRAAITAYC